MKIGIDARELKEKRVGIGSYIYNIISVLNKQDSENEYYLYSNKKIYIDFELKDNWHIKEFDCKVGTRFVYFKLPKILKADCIDVFWGTEHCLPKRNRYTNRIKYVVTIHDLAIQKFKKVGSFYNEIIQKMILKKSCNNADRIIAISEATKTDLIEILTINKDKISVIYLGTNKNDNYSLSDEEEKELLSKYNIENSRFIFFLSTIEPRKNLNTAIRAFERYKEKNSDDLKFIISGGIGWRCKNTLKLIQNSKFKNDIIMTGYINSDEKECFFKYCKAFIYPSLYEGFGLPVLEAMQRGAIVITSNVSSLPEVGGDAAIYLNEVMNIDKLSELYEYVINLGEQEKLEIIKKGYNQVEKFSWVKCAQNTLLLMERMEEER